MAELQWLDEAAEGGWEEFGRLFTAFAREVIPDERAISGDEWRVRARHAAAGSSLHHVVARVDGRAVAAAAFGMNETRPKSSWLMFLYVLPEQRRRGIASSLLRAVRETVGGAGRNRIRVSTANGHPAGEAFVVAAGGKAGLLTEQSRCPVAGMDVARLRAWRDRAAERATGYSLVAFDGVCPEEHLDAFVAVIPIMNTAPRTEGTEDWAPTRQQITEIMAATVQEGTSIWTVCARHDRTGQFVGYTELFFPVHRPWLAAQGDTGVHPDHRARGIGRWLKAETALRLLDERPGVEFIETWNATANAAMLSINRAMGFEPVAYRQEWDVPVRS